MEVLAPTKDISNQVNTFLDSIGRNSKNTKRSYKTSLIHFTEFLKSTKEKQTPDSIIPLLTKGKLNVYELLDQFVSYLTQQQKIAVESINLYLAAVRSSLRLYQFLAYRRTHLN